jgi:hypothetical protein
MATNPTDQRRRQRFNKAMKYLRMFLRDTPELNRLTRDYALDDEHLRFAIDMAISDFNTTLPPTPPKSIDNFPSLWLLIHGAAIHALTMEGIQQTRNELNYQSGGSSFMRSNKTAHLQSWIQMFKNDYEMKKRSIKIAGNVASGRS